MQAQKPLWFIKYDPVRTKVIGKNSMRFTKGPYYKLKDAMADINILSMEKGYSFSEYAVIRWTETDDKIVIQGSIDFDG